MSYRIYTDGACKGNPGPGGWGCLILSETGEDKELYGGEQNTTNNKMELLAVIRALSVLPKGAEAEVYTDSKYVAEGVKNWLRGWVRNGWKTASNKPVKNQDEWKELAQLLERYQVKMFWVKGHSGNLCNDRADALANKGVRSVEDGALPAKESDVAAIYVSGFKPVTSSYYSGWGAVVARSKDLEEVIGGWVDPIAGMPEILLRGILSSLQSARQAKTLVIVGEPNMVFTCLQKYLEVWKQRGWTNEKGEELKHSVLWDKIYWELAGRDWSIKVSESDPMLRLARDTAKREAAIAATNQYAFLRAGEK